MTLDRISGTMVLRPTTKRTKVPEACRWSEIIAATETHFGPSMIWFGFTHSVASLKLRGVQSLAYLREHAASGTSLERGDPLTFLDLTLLRAIGSESPYFFGATEASQPLEASGALVWKRFGNGQGLVFLAIAVRDPDHTRFRARWRALPAEIRSQILRQCIALKAEMVAERLKLTRRQQEVLTLFAGGLGAKAIGRELKIAPKTVFNTLDRARVALAATNTGEAIAKACIYNLL